MSSKKKNGSLNATDSQVLSQTPSGNPEMKSEIGISGVEALRGMKVSADEACRIIESMGAVQKSLLALCEAMKDARHAKTPPR